MERDNWALSYNLKFDNNDGKGYTRTQVDILNEEEGYGFADALFVMSIVRGKDGSISYRPLSVDGGTMQPLDISDIFGVWSTLTNCLAEENRLGEWQTKLVRKVDKEIRHIILIKRKEGSIINGE